ncbi:MAG: hypothetical protein CMM12_07765 [Rhodospirillaceae bacterium]|mgnify:CR=1 FL=1|nr:hypothetical protein [Rhodospirillaceae bacterium]
MVMKLQVSTLRTAACIAFTALFLASCENAVPPVDDPYTETPGQSNKGYNNPKGSIFGEDGVDIFGMFGGGKRGERGGGGSGIGVNNYLWRATLDTISFMPLSSADPFGGVIITDWYSPPEAPNERFKMNVYILGRQLRADGVRVAIFRQAKGRNDWADATVKKETAFNMENQILIRARQLRVAASAEAN